MPSKARYTQRISCARCLLGTTLLITITAVNRQSKYRSINVTAFTQFGTIVFSGCTWLLMPIPDNSHCKPKNTTSSKPMKYKSPYTQAFLLLLMRYAF